MLENVSSPRTLETEPGDVTFQESFKKNLLLGSLAGQHWSMCVVKHSIKDTQEHLKNTLRDNTEKMQGDFVLLGVCLKQVILT